MHRSFFFLAIDCRPYVIARNLVRNRYESPAANGIPLRTTAAKLLSAPRTILRRALQDAVEEKRIAFQAGRRRAKSLICLKAKRRGIVLYMRCDSTYLPSIVITQ
jgi:hypothetical protein